MVTSSSNDNSLRVQRALLFLLLLSSSLISVEYGTKLFRYMRTFPIPPSEFDRAVTLISNLHTNSTSKYGLKYRSLICTVVRNDPHLMEFLLRSLITGFSHIVVYDNNRIIAGYDTNISNTLAPFLAAEVVTHVSWYQNTTELLTNGEKVVGALECIHKYEKYADWVAYLDTDEYLYYQSKNTSVDMLDDLLSILERKKACAARVPMTLMYGEAKMLKQNKTLFEAYPRVCNERSLPKILARPQYTDYVIPHQAKCKSREHTTQQLSWLRDPKTTLIHYYSKSMQEYLEKVDKSMPPYIRKPISSYILGPTCHLAKFPYLEDYERRFLDIYQQLNKSTLFLAVRLRAPPRLSTKLMNDNENALYDEFKYRCEQGHEFDNERYISMHPALKESIRQQRLVDGLYHLMMHFGKGMKGCWKTETDSFCE